MIILKEAAEAAATTFFVVILPMLAAKLYDIVQERTNKRGN